MFDEPYSLQDAGLALHAEWLALAESYERHAAVLLRSGVVGRGVPPGALDRILCDVKTHNDHAAQLRACADSLWDCLEEAESRRMSTDSAQLSRVIHTPPVPGAEGAPHVDPGASSEGRSRPESGQRKSL